MTKIKLCDGKIEPIWIGVDERHRDYSAGWWLSWSNERPENVRRLRLTCPICARRIMSSVQINHDGDFIIHTLPPHKPKGWWKVKHNKPKKSTFYYRGKIK
jgi:hypothetical protein